MICGGSGGQDYANITNILVTCGLMHGVPQRQNGGSSVYLTVEVAGLSHSTLAPPQPKLPSRRYRSLSMELTRT